MNDAERLRALSPTTPIGFGLKASRRRGPPVRATHAWLKPLMLNQKMNVQGRPKRTLKLFLDYWALVRLLEDDSWASHKDCLMAYCKNGDCTLVLTIWHVFEMLGYGDKARAKQRCVHLEELRKEAPCLWIRLRTELQRDEISEAFFQAEGVDYKRKETFYDEPVALIPNSEKASWFEQARRDGLLWFFNKPELLSRPSNSA